MDINERLHRDWIGMAQPEGLVVTPAALKAAEANITSPVIELQAQLRDLAGDGKTDLDLRAFLRDILGWSDEFVAEGDEIPETLRVRLDGGEELAPTVALRSADEPGAFVLLVMRVGRLTGLDAATDDKRWTATAHQRFERLLRDTDVHVGLLTNGKVFRLVYAPKGESAGWVSFRIDDMLQVAGRDLLGALHMLLNERRLLSLDEAKRLTALLKASREYQNTVSNRLREQILSALRELLGGFQQADRMAGGAILRDYAGEHRQEIYGGLVTVLMRMVFTLFAEERGLLPIENDLYADAYSLARLHAQLGDDRTRHGDTLNDRFGAWARVISLFRLLHDGAVAANGLRIPARKGDFFNPDKHPFLEGRPRGAVRQVDEVLDLPRISDGVIFRVLDQLLVLDGERLQYKGLDVEQIGSVYEGLMGFEIEVAKGASIALAPDSAPVVVDLEALLAMPGADRLKFLKSDAGLDVKDKMGGEVRAAKSVDELHAALGRRVSSKQSGIIAKGSLYLQPGEERRKSGSHYTPRSLTAPIVETTLRPVLDRLGPKVTPEQLLDLKICDPAMGSAAFLVEACRQLADHLVGAWRRTNEMPELPPDEDPVLHARRLIAQRCLYGVDKNPLAADLARLSMWLVTFAKEHPFTFVDHSLRCGDSLVGLSREQIASLSLDVAKGAQVETVRAVVEPAVNRAVELRKQIHAIGDPPDTAKLVELWRETNEALDTVRLLGDVVVAAFFSADSDKARRKAFDDLGTKARLWLATGQHAAELPMMRAELREGEKGVAPFHWEIEFPEVFGRENPGFDCFVGNPPFLGGKRISGALGDAYRDWLDVMHAGSSSNADLVALFFRRSFMALRRTGTLGLVATNTISQGDTRKSGLSWIVSQGGSLFAARRRMKWPGNAAVVVSIVHASKSVVVEPAQLDGRAVAKISAYLFDKGGSEEPERLRANADGSYIGVDIKGQGFLFADDDPATTSLAEMRRLLDVDSGNRDRIFSYLGGEDLNNSPTCSAPRFVISFGEMSLEEAKRWPEILRIVEDRVRPERSQKSKDVASIPWWQFWRVRRELYERLAGMEQVLVVARVSKTCAFTMVSARQIFNEKVVVFPVDSYAMLAVLQSRTHEGWARFFSSTLKDDLQYTPSDCFETFPFPRRREAQPTSEAIGKTYYEFRATLMVKNNEGLTRTYNRFHDPEERSAEIRKLRELHAAMDRAVLDAYGWSDIRPTYDFREQLDEHVRLTWDDDTRDEVLARLLELNRVRAEEEARDLAAKAPEPKAAAKRKAKPGSGSSEGGQGGLFS
jgi:hypothetical protein